MGNSTIKAVHQRRAIAKRKVSYDDINDPKDASNTSTNTTLDINTSTNTTLDINTSTNSVTSTNATTHSNATNTNSETQQHDSQNSNTNITTNPTQISASPESTANDPTITVTFTHTLTTSTSDLSLTVPRAHLKKSNSNTSTTDTCISSNTTTDTYISSNTTTTTTTTTPNQQRRKRKSLVPLMSNLRLSRVHTKPVKVLLLGEHRSGKSTLTRHIRLVVGAGVSLDERMLFVPLVRACVVRLFEAVVDGSERLGLFADEKSRFDATGLMLRSLHSDMQPRLAHQMSVTWSSHALQCAYHNHRHQLHIPITAKHFLDQCEVIASADYVPSNEDILLVEMKSSAITETVVDIHDTRFKILDVEGRRYDRSQWVQCFDDARVIVFVCALDEYCEDIEIVTGVAHNRLHDTLSLFSGIVNSHFCVTLSVLLVLNKKHVFEDMINHIDLADTFPEYSGGSDSKQAIAFITSQFLNSINDETRKRDVHVIATDCVEATGVTAILDAMQRMANANT